MFLWTDEIGGLSFFFCAGLLVVAKDAEHVIINATELNIEVCPRQDGGAAWFL